MPEEHASVPVRARLLTLVACLWALVATFSYLFVKTVFGLSAGQQSTFALAFWISAAVAAGVSLAGVHLLLRPVEEYRRNRSAGGEMPQALVDRAAGSAGHLFARLGLLGLAVPVAWLTVTGGLMVGLAQVSWTKLGYFIALGLFDAMLLGALLFFIPQGWLLGTMEALARARPDALMGKGISLKWKILVLGFMLATLPTLLVGSMSFATANRLLDEEAGEALREKLLRLNDEVATLLSSGADRLSVERQMTRTARSIGQDGFVHMGTAEGEFYRSEHAGSLSPELYRRIRGRHDPRRADTASGTIDDVESGRAYTYAFSSDGKLVSIAPVRHARSQTTNTLWWMIVGITFCSMGVAVIVGYAFAANLGAKIRRMAELTEEIARGQLGRDIQILSDDELGTLGAGLGSMSDNLRRMVSGMTDLATQMAATCNQLLFKASAIATGAELQSQSVNETSGSVEELNGNIQAATDSLGQLALATQETTEAANKVGESFNRMLTEAGSLQDTVEKTDRIVRTMVASVGEVAGHILELSEGADRSASSMTEMDRSIASVTESASETARIAREAIDAAQDGAVAVRRTIEGMDRIVDSSRRATDVIVGLGNRVEDIGSILGVIEEIADQTNLLALNAAIIAAQAGEHGRSFAVVADEIRSLAERTASSTREIAQMIADIQETSEEASSVMRGGASIVNEGVTLAQQAGDSLNQILISVQKAAANVAEIAHKSEYQARASETVTKEIGKVAEMATRISTAASEQTQAGEQLEQAFKNTLATSQNLGTLVNQQSQENRQAMAAVSTTNEAATRANEAMQDQSAISEGILRAIEQIREIAKNHADAASEMGEATKALAEKSARLKEEIGEFQV